MFKGKLSVTITTVLILTFAVVIFTLKQTNKIDAASLTISSNEIELVNRTGGLPLSSWKVLFASKDDSVINKIVSLVNTANKTEFNAKDYDSGKGAGYPVGIVIKLKNNIEWRVWPLFKVDTRNLENGGMESTSTPYRDRVVLNIEEGEKISSYTLFSEQVADYVLEGVNKDMPHVTAFSLTPDTIKPGETISISGDGSIEKYIEIYVTDGNSDSKEKYLIDRVATSFGAWKWEGTINGRTIRTLDGKDIKLTKDWYHFETSVASGGGIDLSGIK